MEDAKRDWEAVGGDPDDIHNLNQWKLGTSVELSEGIIYLTYSTLGVERQDRSRFNQIVEWLGTDFEGSIIFDEAHQMGNAATVKTSSGYSKQASKQGMAGVRLQRLSPRRKNSLSVGHWCNRGQ